MISGYYEEVAINSDKIKLFDKVITTINYDKSKVEQSLYKANLSTAEAKARVAPEVLQELLEKDRQVATHDCNVLKFTNINFDGTSVIAKLFPRKGLTAVGVSGRIWYPEANGYMGWHTNSNNQGYRFYCTYVREADKSFFRYRHPLTHEIITSWDKAGWTFRIFKVANELLWHCVFSETDRFSIGYALYTDDYPIVEQKNQAGI